MLIPLICLAVVLLLLLTIQTVSIMRIWVARVELVQELDRQKDELLSIVSHQLATPVSSVKWYLEMLLDGDVGTLSKDQQEYLGTMQSVTHDLSDLVSMILDVSRIQLGKMKVDRQELDLNVFFKEILSVIEPKAKEKHQQFIVKIDDNLPKAMLDKRLTRMTIENLLSNAVKYTPAEGKVSFVVSRQDEKVHVEVKDTGVGIPEKDKEKIFGKLFRASNTGSIEGNGFGLYVAKGAIEAQGGKIWFESKENEGTKFFVDLPVPRN
jgi:signal transduction histidine kinase